MRMVDIARRRQRFGTILAMTLACIAGGTDASPATATSLPLAIAPLAADVPISAGSGWLIWSVPAAAGDWALEAYHDGALTAIRVASRPQPFDVNVGTDAHGSPVATFSRCTRTPKMESVGTEVTGGTEPAGGSMLRSRSGVGCRLRVYELSSNHESALPIPRPAGASDTTPSMWRGNVAFARIAPAHGGISQIMLWSPRHPYTLRVLPGGAIPPDCAGKIRCHGEPVYREVQALDLDADVVTFTWAIKAPTEIGHGGWEVRVDDLADARGNLAASGFIAEACMGGGIELERLEAPIAVGDGALFSEFRRSRCYEEHVSMLYDFHAGAQRASSGLLPGNVLGLAKDGNTLYALAAPTPEFSTDPSCSSTAPCTLERIAEPRLTLNRSKPKSPFA